MLHSASDIWRDFAEPRLALFCSWLIDENRGIYDKVDKVKSQEVGKLG